MTDTRKSRYFAPDQEEISKLTKEFLKADQDPQAGFVVMANNARFTIAMDALKEIVDPIGVAQSRLKEGERLDGVAVVMLSKDPEYLRSIAKRALDKLSLAESMATLSPNQENLLKYKLKKEE